MSRRGTELGTVFALGILAVVASGCGDDRDPATAHLIGGVVERGEPDVAHFRAIVDAGEVPARDVLDPVGFFAEHTIELPPADCGEELCIHPSLAVASRFAGGNWTMAFVGMNTSLDVSTLARAPLHIALVVEASRATLRISDALQVGLRALLAELRTEDRVTLVPFGATVPSGLAVVAPDAPDLDAAIRVLVPRAATDAVAPYEGLAAAARTLALSPAGTVRHVVLVTTGAATAGVTSHDRLLAVVADMARAGISVSVVGVGLDSDYLPRLPVAIGDLGAGAFVRATSGPEITEALRLDGERTLFPIATDLALHVVPARGYHVGRVYGAPGAITEPTGVALISPAIFVEQGLTALGGGRRGGSGGVFVELVADRSSGIVAGAPAFSVEATWLSRAGDSRATTRAVSNTLAPGETPADSAPRFGESGRGKPFVMLNLYLALHFVAAFHEDGDCSRAMGLADQVTPGVERWQAPDPDSDIAADTALLLRLRQNVEDACPSTWSEPPDDFTGGCMSL